MPELDWKVPPDFGEGVQGMAMGIAAAADAEASKLLHAEVPELAGLADIGAGRRCDAHFDPVGWFVLRVIVDRRARLNPTIQMKAQDLELIKGRIAGPLPAKLEQVAQLLGSEWVGPDRMTYVGRYDGPHVSWLHIYGFVKDWVNDFVLPHVSDINQARVLRVIPTPPVYDLSLIAGSLWVLESEKNCVQGSAFMLEEVGLVTCRHCLFTDTKAFHADRPIEKFPVSVSKRHDVIDLAVCQIDAPPSKHLARGQPSELEMHDHLLVCGHPNYRIGDSAMSIPGLVVGFRMMSSIRRIITNAPIVAGSSGSPVLSHHNKVVGVAVTGSQSFSSASGTEDHGIVPIDALDLF